MFVATPLSRGWAFDTVHVFTPADAAHLKAASYPGTPLLALWRYVSLGAPSPADITTAERDAILGAGWLLGLVQHVERPSWQANGSNGLSHGTTAAAHARLVEYPLGCHLGLDLEGLSDSGAPVMSYVQAWADAVHAVGHRVLLYVGYDDGLTDAQVTTLVGTGAIDAFWSDFGPRSLPPPLSFAMKQHAQATVLGIGVDPDEVLVAGTISVMGIMPADRTTEPELPEPHPDVTDPHV